MEFSTMKINEYIEKLSSKSAVPGGGGTSALVGALGLALGQILGAYALHLAGSSDDYVGFSGDGRPFISIARCVDSGSG